MLPAAPAPPATPHPRRSAVEAFRYSLRRGLSTTVRRSVPVFLLRTSAGPRRSGAISLQVAWRRYVHECRDPSIRLSRR